MTKHDKHQFTCIKGPFIYPGKHLWNPGIIHDGKYICTTCNIQLKWVNNWQIELFNEHYKENMTYGTFNKIVDAFIHSVSENDPRIIFLAVPFRDKDKVKTYGATWDSFHKLWYTTFSRKKVEQLIPWMLPDDVEKLKKFMKAKNK